MTNVNSIIKCDLYSYEILFFLMLNKTFLYLVINSYVDFPVIKIIKTIELLEIRSQKGIKADTPA